MWGDGLRATVAQLPSSPVQPDDARRAARQILAQPEYASPEPSLLDRAWQWFQDQLGQLLGGLGGPGGGYWFGITVIVVCLAVAVVLGVRFLPRGRRRRGPGLPAAAVATHGPGPTRLELLERAAVAEAEGRWADAVADRYRALVVGLAEQRRLPDDPAVTTGDLRRAFQGGNDDRCLFDRASTRFERVRYRGDPAGPEDPRQLWEWDRLLVGGPR